MVRGNSLISHLLLLIASRHGHTHWHSESHPIESTLDCEDCQWTQSNFEQSLESDEAVTGALLEGITSDVVVPGRSGQDVLM